MSKRLTPIVVAQRQIEAWEDKRQRLVEQLNAASAHIERWEMVRDAMARDEATADDFDEVQSLVLTTAPS